METSVTLTAKQSEALAMMQERHASKRSEIFCLAGLSGTGKTTVLSHFYNGLEKPEEVAFLCLTGRAAANLSVRGVPAYTIHSLFYELRESRDGKLVFSLRRYAPKGLKALIIDEASMLTKKMLEDLQWFGLSLSLAGDPGQLPAIGDSGVMLRPDQFPVDGGAYIKPDIFLDEIVRQKDGNQIPVIARDIYNNKIVGLGNYGDDVAIVRKQRITDSTLNKADQIIVATNKERKRINKLIRKMRGFSGNFPMVGDRLICTRNIWELQVEGVPIINGMTGTCMSIEMRGNMTAMIHFKPDHSAEKSVPILIDLMLFEGNERATQQKLGLFDFGYAITLHKAQGSEWDNVVVVRDSILPNIPERSWIYTAMTRAKQRLILGV